MLFRWMHVYVYVHINEHVYIHTYMRCQVDHLTSHHPMHAISFIYEHLCLDTGFMNPFCGGLSRWQTPQCASRPPCSSSKPSLFRTPKLHRLSSSRFAPWMCIVCVLRSAPKCMHIMYVYTMNRSAPRMFMHGSSSDSVNKHVVYVPVCGCGCGRVQGTVNVCMHAYNRSFSYMPQGSINYSNHMHILVPDMVLVQHLHVSIIYALLPTYILMWVVLNYYQEVTY